ncbi:MAG TPA: hypothetical protein V6D13_00920 [Halomicronema sp.]
MPTPTVMSAVSIEELVQEIFSSRKITRNTQQKFMGVLLSKNTINSSEQSLITRVFDGLQKGTIRVVD